MKDIEYTFIDKSSWPEGPWKSEVDKIQYTDKETGYPCLIVRHRTFGHLCGYVGASENHPHFKKSYHDIGIDVHGELTFSDFCNASGNEHRICHKVEEGEDDLVWWLGFDCAHVADLSPAYSVEQFPNAGRLFNATYKTIDFVKGQNMSLARQLKEYEAL